MHNRLFVLNGRSRTRSCIPLLFSTMLAMLAPNVYAGIPKYTDIMPVSQIRPGMKGYGLTTFHGITISRFDVTIIGVLAQANFGHDLILIRMKGGPITERGANLIHGMSGSPVYIGGKIIGAFSQGEQWPKEPIGMVTPIQDMLEAWDPNIPQKPGYFQPAEQHAKPVAVKLPQPIMVGSRRITSLVLGAPESVKSREGAAALHNATSFLYAPGAKESNRLWLQKALEQKGYHYTVLSDSGGGRSTTFHGAPLRPGSCFGTMLAEGDIPFGGYGTITYRKGDRVLGFGHPLMGLGALEGAITSAYVVDVFSGLQTSHLMPIAGPVVGTLRQDRDFSVSGDLSSKPHLIPFEVTINDETTHRSHTFQDHILQHPDLTPQLMSFVAKEAVSRVHDIPGDVMATVTTTVDAAEIGTITRTNTVYDSVDISGPGLMDLSDITGVVSGNPFYPLPVKSAKIIIDIRAGHETATLDRIFLKQGKFEPGELLQIGVVLKPYRQEPVVRTIALKIPADTPIGRYQLIVRGGMAPLMRFGGVVFGGGGDVTTPPVNVKQMARQLTEKETNTDVVARLMLNTYAPAVDGVRLSQMPPNLAALMRSERNSGVRLEREELKSRQAAGFVVSGTQQLFVTIAKKSTQESPINSLPNLPSTQGGGSGLPVTLPPPGGPGAALIGDPSGDSIGESIGDPPSVNANSSPAYSPEFSRWLFALNEGRNGQAQPPAAQGKANSDASAKAAASSTFSVTEPPSTESGDSASEKPVGRQPVSWRQSAKLDFNAGKFTGLGVTAAGQLRISAALKRLATTNETYIWSLAADSQGSLYAGTGTNGKILKIDTAGHTSVYAALPAVSIQTLLVAKDGSLWAGTGGNGAVYHITSESKPILVRTLKERFVLALAQDSKGNIYIGAGGGGAIYRITPVEQNAPQPLMPPAVYYTTPAQHIMALAVDGSDNLYAGAAPEGIVYRIGADGKGAALYDAKENAIMAISTGASGDVYAATGPRGIVYAVHPDGSAVALFDHAPNFFTAIKTAPDGSLYASTATSIYHITPPKHGDSSPAVIVPLDNPKDVDYLCLTIAASGAPVGGTGNVGEVFAVAQPNNSAGSASSGVFESVVRDAKLPSQWGTLRWEATIPAGAGVLVSTRSGNVAEPDAAWSSWSPVRQSDSRREGIITSPQARYIQYRLELTSSSTDPAASPEVREVTLSYMPKNQAPKVSFMTPAGGERWAKSQTVRWNANDPDNDTLSYTLEYSSDSGATWKQVSAGKGRDDAAASGSPGSGKAPLSMAEFEKQLDSSMPPFLRKIALDKHKSILEGGGADSASSSRDKFRHWDTSGLPDGTYLLRVSATDSASNPIDPRTTTAVSEPFIICNAPPVLRVIGKPEIRSDGSVAIHGVASQKLAAVVAVQYRVDTGDWTSATPDDGLFDSGSESFQFVTAPVSKGKHTVEVLGFNSAGEHSSIKVEVLAP